MRLLIIALLLSLLSACGGTPTGVPLEAPVVAVSPSAQALEVDPLASEAHPASVTFGTWIADSVTIVVAEKGVGPVAAGTVSLTPYTVTSAGADEVVLTTSNGTVYRFALGSEPSLSSSALPNIKLLQN